MRNQPLRIRRFITEVPVKVPADMYFHRVIDLVQPLSVSVLFDNNMHCCPLAEVIHHEPCEKFLQYRISVLCVEIRYSDGVFQLPEACPDFPSEMVQIFQNGRRGGIFRK